MTTDKPARPTGRKRTAPAKAAGKARLRTLDALDHRTAAARRALDLVSALTVDLGGADNLSAGQVQLVQRAALLGAYIEDCEARWVAGDSIDVTEWLAACNTQKRILQTLGLERRARDVTPRLSEILAGRA